MAVWKKILHTAITVSIVQSLMINQDEAVTKINCSELFINLKLFKYITGLLYVFWNIRKVTFYYSYE
ncbi:MAG: hypothetical protein K0R09_2132 [Clostridiales bacterium]|nr:hypothetical protein [Clostridiales bacterium]